MTPQEIKHIRRANRYAHIVKAAIVAVTLTWAASLIAEAVDKAKYDYRMSCSYGAACESQF